MKVLLFTHKSDIDGMGSAILAKLAFNNVNYILCEPFSLQQEVKKFYENKEIYNYDKVYITDLWLEEPLLSSILRDEKLQDKFYIFDHHKSIEHLAVAKNTIVKVSNDLGLCSGTSLFYEYLITNNYLDKNNHTIKDFVELTRKYDTWEWKTKYQDEMPHELSLLFDCLGINWYIDLMYRKLSDKENEVFYFNEFEKMLINNKAKHLHEKLARYAEKISYKKVLDKKAGIVFIDYEYRNDLALYLRENNYDMDFVMLVALDHNTISYRSIKDVNVRLIAEYFGGKGHDKAASSPITDNQKNKLIDILTNII